MPTKYVGGVIFNLSRNRKTAKFWILYAIALAAVKLHRMSSHKKHAMSAKSKCRFGGICKMLLSQFNRL